MHTPSVVWVECDHGVTSKKAAQQFREAGLPLVSCALGKSAFVGADARVLPVDCFRSDVEFRKEYGLGTRPRLILLGSEDPWLAASEIAKDVNNVGLVIEPVELLARRISRLPIRANDTQRLAAINNVDLPTGLSIPRQFKPHLTRHPEALAPGKNKASKFVDVDGLKSVNDRYGHESGDRVLRRGARWTDNVDGVVALVEMAVNGLLEAQRLGRNRVAAVGEYAKAQAAQAMGH